MRRANGGAQRRRLAPTLAGVVIGMLAFVGAPAAQAAFPGHNGKIAFTFEQGGSANVAVIEPDGTGRTELTTDPAWDGQPKWSPDGRKIVFHSFRGAGDGNLWLIDADGANEIPLTSAAGDDYDAQWSPDGTKIAFTSVRDGNEEIYVMDADGSNEVRVTNHPQEDNRATWSPDGTKLVFTRFTFPTFPNEIDVYTIRPDGSGLTNLTWDANDADSYSGSAYRTDGSAWSPSGAKIAFRTVDSATTLKTMNPDGSGKFAILTGGGNWGHRKDFRGWAPVGARILFRWAGPFGAQGPDETYSMNPDGTDIRRLTTDPEEQYAEVWSPDAKYVAGERHTCVEGGCAPVELFVVRSDGSDLIGIGPGRFPDWQPIPINAYPRPKGATPFLTYLVPAYGECTTPNREHGPSLSFGSCNPPAQTSDELTIGSADSNAKPTKSVSSVRFDTLVGNPSTPTDEADVRITAQVIDVYTQAGLADYAGEVTAKTTLRITDKLNTPSPGGPGAGTVSDIPYGFTIPCAVTADTTIGGACLLSTSADALAPGAVTEGKRSIWGLGAVEVYDANDDRFMKQGIFVP